MMLTNTGPWNIILICWIVTSNMLWQCITNEQMLWTDLYIKQDTSNRYLIVHLLSGTATNSRLYRYSMFVKWLVCFMNSTEILYVCHAVKAVGCAFVPQVYNISQLVSHWFEDSLFQVNRWGSATVKSQENWSINTVQSDATCCLGWF